MEKLIETISSVVESTFERGGYHRRYGKVSISNRPDLCQYQCNGALVAAKEYKKAPIKIADEVASLLGEENLFEKVESVAPGFINITLKDSYISEYLNKIKEEKDYGVDKIENPKTIVLDYGGPNIAKPLHVGHLRPAIIGEAIKRTARFLGENIIGDVHLGDWGLPIGMVIYELKNRYSYLPYFNEDEAEYPSEAFFTIKELEEIYPYASKLAKENEEVMAEVQNITALMQRGHKGYLALLKKIVEVSVGDLKKNYQKLNVDFDLWLGESDCQQYIEDMIKYFKDNEYAYVSQGALVIDVKKEEDKKEIPPIIIQKSNGAYLYGTTDLATIWARIKDYKPDEIAYVVDKRQELYFEQVFRAAKKTKIVSEDVKLDFVGFGTMNGKDGKPFKTRDGGVMRLQELIETIQEKISEKLEDKYSKEEAKEISEKVGIAALKYADLSNTATKDYIFDIDKFTSYEGNTGPYILYTAVRIKSILNKVEGIEKSNILPPHTATERELMLLISRFSDSIKLSYENKAPHIICDYLYSISTQFNKFYGETKILSEKDEDRKASWLELLKLTLNIIVLLLDLLGIEVPDKM